VRNGTFRNAAVHWANITASHGNVGDSPAEIERLRNALPALVMYQSVYFDALQKCWIVDTSNIRRLAEKAVLPLYIGGCPVYTIDLSTDIVQAMGDDGFCVHPRQVVDDAELERISSRFPHSIGMRVYLGGYVEILYNSTKQIRQEQNSTDWLPGSIGEMTYGLTVLETYPTTQPVSTGSQVAATPEELIDLRGCLGLRIKLQDSHHDAWMTTTHAWVQRPARRDNAKANFFANILSLARRNRKASSLINSLTAPISQGRTTKTQSPVGAEVYVAHTKTLVCFASSRWSIQS
jgi:hypothetical protein